MLVQIGTKQSGSSFSLSEGDESYTPALQRYLQVLVKLHQALGLIEGDFSKLASDSVSHIKELLASLEAKGSLDFYSRQRSTNGRVFEHAAECKLLVQHLGRISKTV